MTFHIFLKRFKIICISYQIHFLYFPFILNLFKVFYKKDVLEQPKKIEDPEDLEIDLQDPTAPGYNKRRAKTETIPIWLVKLEIPRQFIDEYYSEQVYVDGLEIDIDDKVEMDIDSEEADEMPTQQQSDQEEYEDELTPA